MFNKIFSESHVKLTKAQWNTLEDTFRNMQNEIASLKAELAKTDDIREENSRLKHYQANDELLYNSEQYCKKLVKENNELKEAIEATAQELDKMNMAFKASRSLESVYLQKIHKMKQSVSATCFDYETKDIRTLGISIQA